MGRPIKQHGPCAGAVSWRVKWRWIGDGERTHHWRYYIAASPEAAVEQWAREYPDRDTYELMTVAPRAGVSSPQLDYDYAY